MARVLTWVIFFVAIARALAPIPEHDPHHIEVIINAFLLIVSAALVVWSFRKSE